jgi:hypothetical protein
VLGVVAVVGNMPMLVLVVLSSVAGAISVVGGLMLVVGSLDTADIRQGGFTRAAQDGWGWYAVAAALALLGILVQTRQRVARQRSVRQAWYVEAR